MLNEVSGDILNDEFNFICQQVNCKGVMGAGLALKIRSKYPFVFTEYANVCKTEPNPLGHVLFSHASGLNAQTIVSMFAQDGYGRDKNYTDYKAFQHCLDVLADQLEMYSANWTVAFPYKIGCGLAGGDWKIIKLMLEDFAQKVKQQVYIVRKIGYGEK